MWGVWQGCGRCVTRVCDLLATFAALDENVVPIAYTFLCDFLSWSEPRSVEVFLWNDWSWRNDEVWNKEQIGGDNVLGRIAECVWLASSLSALAMVKTGFALTLRAILRRSALGTRRTARTPASTKYFRAMSSMPSEVRMTLAPLSRIFSTRALVMSFSLQKRMSPSRSCHVCVSHEVYLSLIFSSSSASVTRICTPIWALYCFRGNSRMAIFAFSTLMGIPVRWIEIRVMAMSGMRDDGDDTDRLDRYRHVVAVDSTSDIHHTVSVCMCVTINCLRQIRSHSSKHSLWSSYQESLTIGCTTDVWNRNAIDNDRFSGGFAVRFQHIDRLHWILCLQMNFWLRCRTNKFTWPVFGSIIMTFGTAEQTKLAKKSASPPISLDDREVFATFKRRSGPAASTVWVRWVWIYFTASFPADLKALRTHEGCKPCSTRLLPRRISSAANITTVVVPSPTY